MVAFAAGAVVRVRVKPRGRRLRRERGGGVMLVPRAWLCRSSSGMLRRFPPRQGQDNRYLSTVCCT
eukprot:6191197-Pleurochrysis_carterae.AAC.3